MQTNNTDQQNLPNFGSATRDSNPKISQSAYTPSTQAIRMNQQMESQNTGQMSRSTASPMHIDLAAAKQAFQQQQQLNTPNYAQQNLSQESPFTPPRKHPLISNNTNSNTTANTKPRYTPNTASSKVPPVPINQQNASGLSQSPYGSAIQREISPYSREPMMTYSKALDSVAILGNEFEQTIKAFENVQNELNQWREKCQKLTDDYENRSQEDQQEFQETKSKLEQSEREIEKLTIIVEGVNQKLEFNSQKMKTLERKCQDYNVLEQKYNQLKQNSRENDTKVKILETELQSAKDLLEIKDREISELEVFKREYADLNERVQQLEKENNDLKNNIDDRDKTLEQQLNIIEQLSNTNNQLEQENNELKNHFAEFEQQVEIVHDEIDMGLMVASSNMNTSHNLQSQIYMTEQMSQNEKPHTHHSHVENEVKHQLANEIPQNENQQENTQYLKQEDQEVREEEEDEYVEVEEYEEVECDEEDEEGESEHPQASFQQHDDSNIIYQQQTQQNPDETIVTLREQQFTQEPQHSVRNAQPGMLMTRQVQHPQQNNQFYSQYVKPINPQPLQSAQQQQIPLSQSVQQSQPTQQHQIAQSHYEQKHPIIQSQHQQQPINVSQSTQQDPNISQSNRSYQQPQIDRSQKQQQPQQLISSQNLKQSQQQKQGDYLHPDFQDVQNPLQSSVGSALQSSTHSVPPQQIQNQLLHSKHTSDAQYPSQHLSAEQNEEPISFSQQSPQIIPQVGGNYQQNISQSAKISPINQSATQNNQNRMVQTTYNPNQDQKSIQQQPHHKKQHDFNRQQCVQYQDPSDQAPLSNNNASFQQEQEQQQQFEDQINQSGQFIPQIQDGFQVEGTDSQYEKSPHTHMSPSNESQRRVSDFVMRGPSDSLKQATNVILQQNQEYNPQIQQYSQKLPQFQAQIDETLQEQSQEQNEDISSEQQESSQYQSQQMQQPFAQEPEQAHLQNQMVPIAPQQLQRQVPNSQAILQTQSVQIGNVGSPSVNNLNKSVPLPNIPHRLSSTSSPNNQIPQQQPQNLDSSTAEVQNPLIQSSSIKNSQIAQRPSLPVNSNNITSTQSVYMPTNKQTQHTPHSLVQSQPLQQAQNKPFEGIQNQDVKQQEILQSQQPNVRKSIAHSQNQQELMQSQNQNPLIQSYGQPDVQQSQNQSIQSSQLQKSQQSHSHHEQEENKDLNESNNQSIQDSYNSNSSSLPNQLRQQLQQAGQNLLQTQSAYIPQTKKGQSQNMTNSQPLVNQKRDTIQISEQIVEKPLEEELSQQSQQTIQSSQIQQNTQQSQRPSIQRSQNQDPLQQSLQQQDNDNAEENYEEMQISQGQNKYKSVHDVQGGIVTSNSDQLREQMQQGGQNLLQTQSVYPSQPKKVDPQNMIKSQPIVPHKRESVQANNKIMDQPVEEEQEIQQQNIAAQQTPNVQPYQQHNQPKQISQSQYQQSSSVQNQLAPFYSQVQKPGQGLLPNNTQQQQQISVPPQSNNIDTSQEKSIIESSHTNQMQKSQQQASLQQSQDITPLQQSQNQTPLQLSQNQTVIQQSQQQTPLKQSQQNTPLKSSSQLTPLKQSQNQIPIQQSQDLNTVQQPHQNLLEQSQNQGMNQLSQQLTPSRQSQQLTPSRQSQQLTPLTQSQNQIQIQQSQNQTPLKSSQLQTPIELSQQQIPIQQSQQHKSIQQTQQVPQILQTQAPIENSQQQKIIPAQSIIVSKALQSTNIQPSGENKNINQIPSRLSVSQQQPTHLQTQSQYIPQQSQSSIPNSNANQSSQQIPNRQSIQSQQVADQPQQTMSAFNNISNTALPPTSQAIGLTNDINQSKVKKTKLVKKVVLKKKSEVLGASTVSANDMKNTASNPIENKSQKKESFCESQSSIKKSIVSPVASANMSKTQVPPKHSPQAAPIPIKNPQNVTATPSPSQNSNKILEPNNTSQQIQNKRYSMNQSAFPLQPRQSISMLSQSKEMRSVASGQNNMLNKVIAMKNQLIEKNNEVDALKLKIDENLQQIEALSSDNAQLNEQNLATKEELEQVQKQLQENFEFHKSEIDNLRQEYENTIAPLLQEKQSLEESNIALSKQCEAFDIALQNSDEDKQKAIRELINEKEQLQNFSEAILKEKDLVRRENLSLKDEQAQRNQLENSLIRDNEDQKNLISCQQKDIETWKLKYKNLKKEINGLRMQFDSYKNKVLHEVQAQINDKSNNFQGVLTSIKKKYYEQGDSNLSSAREMIIQQDQQESVQPTSSYNIPRQSINQVQPSQTQQVPQQNYHNQVYQQQQTPSYQKSRPINQYTPVKTTEFVPNQLQNDEQFLNELKYKINALKQTQAEQEALQIKSSNQLQSLQMHQSIQQQFLSAQKQKQQQLESQQKQQETQQQSPKSEQKSEQKSFEDKEDSQQDQIISSNQEDSQSDEPIELQIQKLMVLKSQYEQALGRVNNSMSPQKRK